MKLRPISDTPSQIIVEQLAASGVKYVFNNSGSREALFFDALHAHTDIHGILGLHEGVVTAMAGGYTQVKLDPAVMVVHLGAGLAQCLGQLINVSHCGLPVVVITFAGDTGSFGDRIGLDLSHDVGPTFISEPFTKANWTVIEPEGLPNAIDRALRVARTPPVGPVHLAIYDRLLERRQVNTHILEGALPSPRSGSPADEDVEAVVEALHEAERPIICCGDGVWKSGAECQVVAFAERFGVPISGGWNEMRRGPRAHPLHCGRFDEAAEAINPDLIVCLGLRYGGRGNFQDFDRHSKAGRIVAIGPGVQNHTNLPGLDLAILADERRTLERLIRADKSSDFEARRELAQKQAASLHAKRRKASQSAAKQTGFVRPSVLVDALDEALERQEGGLAMVEQYALPLDSRGKTHGSGNSTYIWAAGGSEGYGIGGTLGLKLAAPDQAVVGIVGDGSMFYADSGLWTAAHHRIPVLFVIPNNRSYGIVASAFGRAGAKMKETGEYAGVVLDKIEPVKIAEGFGVEGMCVDNEEKLGDAIAWGMKVTEEKKRPFLLDVRLPLGVPEGGKEARQYRLVETDSG